MFQFFFRRGSIVVSMKSLIRHLLTIVPIFQKYLICICWYYLNNSKEFNAGFKPINTSKNQGCLIFLQKLNINHLRRCDKWSFYTLLLSKSLSVVQLTIFLQLVTLQWNTLSISCARTYVEIFYNSCSGTLKIKTSLQMFFTHFSSSRPMEWFPNMGKFTKNQKG